MAREKPLGTIRVIGAGGSLKSKKLPFILFLLLSSILLATPASAHVPLQPDDNESLETATVVFNPTKSWAIYAELHEGGEAQYYRLDLKEGERLRAMLYIPLGEKGFKPNLVIIGPGIAAQDEVPEYVEVPEEAGVVLLEADEAALPEYEPFTPSSYYYLADFDLEISAPGEYFIAIYEPDSGGNYGLAIGYKESFELDEWLLVPIDALDIHQWEGQSLALILAPVVATVATGLFIFLWLKKDLFRTVRIWIASLAGLLYIGSGFMTLVQMFIALSSTAVDASVVLTMVFVTLPILLGLGILMFGAKETVTFRARVIVALFALLGLFAWAGLLIGPLLAFVASIFPSSQMLK